MAYRIVGERSSYCDLSDQFLIRVHGLSMGAVTTIVSLVVYYMCIPVAYYNNLTYLTACRMSSYVHFAKSYFALLGIGMSCMV